MLTLDDVGENETVAVIHSGPDGQGRYGFTKFWRATYHPGHPDGEHRLAVRGQGYFARKEDHLSVTRWIDNR